MCGEWAVFYHSYNASALLYEVNACIYKLLFRMGSDGCALAPLPRLFTEDFADVPDTTSLRRKFHSKLTSETGDHDPGYRAVAISAMCSLVAVGPEASTPVVFIGGYSHPDDPVDYKNILSALLTRLVAAHLCPGKKKAAMKKLATRVGQLVDKIIKLSEDQCLDVSAFGGKPCPSNKSGHLLQIFIKRDCLDELAYSSLPMGDIDLERDPLSKWLGEDENTNYGQARIIAQPERFTNDACVRTFAASADPTFDTSRETFQLELTKLIQEDFLSDIPLRESATVAISERPPSQ